jgi:hypothetical protein
MSRQWTLRWWAAAAVASCLMAPHSRCWAQQPDTDDLLDQAQTTDRPIDQQIAPPGQPDPDQPLQDQGQDPQLQDQRYQQDQQRRQLDQQGDRARQADQQRPADPRQQQQPTQDARRPAGLGVAVVQQGDERVHVARVYQESPAELAGIRQGDQIIQIDGQPIHTVDDLLTTVRQSEPGRTVQISINRNGDRQTLEVSLQTRSEALSRQGPQFDRIASAPWSDDLAAHIDILEQEVRRLSEEIADLKAMLIDSPAEQWNREPRQSQRSSAPAYGQTRDGSEQRNPPQAQAPSDRNPSDRANETQLNETQLNETQ